MSDFILSCCSTADMPKAYFIKRDIHYICFHFQLDGVSYKDDLGESMSILDFYKKMQDGADAKTSQINTAEFCEYFEPFLMAGKDILHITMSSGLSGVTNSAMVARNLLLEKYPERKIEIVDSLAASSGYGLLVDKAADLRDEGRTLEEIRDFMDANKKKLNHWFFSTDLTFFIKGGRVSKTAGIVGGLLNICPLLHVDKDGKLIPKEKVRTKKRVIQETVKKMEALAEDGTDYAGKCFISHSACIEDARAVAALIEQKFPKLNGRVEIYDIGTTVGCHTGPGTVALFFWGQERQ